MIKLIPKNAARDSIGGRRPITLLSVTYKIMVKAVALRVRDVARKIVRREKTGFVQGRFIETVISAWEAMEWARDKAYYRIDWTFITDMFTCLGFGPRCVGMVITLFSYASALISVINTLYPRIHLHKSIRQGCPLAPYLYELMLLVIC